MTKTLKRSASIAPTAIQFQRPKLEGSTICDIDSDMEDSKDLVFRMRTSPNTEDVRVSIHPSISDNAVLVSIQPPREPTKKMQHVPCDIVLVIDVSGSMASAASLPAGSGKSEAEDTGLSILDLTKHAARTVLESMNKNDRLGIVTFSSNAKVIQPLTPMTDKARMESWGRIDKLEDQDSTNLWGGIRKGLSLFEDKTKTSNVQGMFVLTDGQPNHMCPHQGYVPKLKPILAKMRDQNGHVPMIHTFGFGYSIRSGLLQSLAEVGNGSYAFIPDAGMIGTVFVHAISNLYNTFAVDATLSVETSDMMKLNHGSGLPYVEGDSNQLTIDLGSLHYGQSRDIVLELADPATASGQISILTQYRTSKGDRCVARASTLLQQNTQLSPETLQYHLIRTELCALLGRLFPENAEGEHIPLEAKPGSMSGFGSERTRLQDLASRIKHLAFVDDPRISSMLEDLSGAEPHGQIAKALESNSTSSNNARTSFQGSNWQRWGQHYLPSLLHAHMRQVCNSFKDPGPLCYGTESPMFIKCRDELDDKFDNLPAPKPSRRVWNHSTNSHTSPRKAVSMKMFHSSSNPCFKETCHIRLGDDSTIPILNLRPGMQVWTPVGARRVSAVIRTAAAHSGPQTLCAVGDLWITPWHPMKHDEKWVFPADISEATEVQSHGSVISVLLDASDDPAAHAVEVSGQVCVTLGHGITRDKAGESDVRAHTFFGNYSAIVQSLGQLLRDKTQVLQCRGVKRHAETGLACGFLNRSDLLVQMSAGFGVPTEEDWGAEKVSCRQVPEQLLGL